jgi:hypothetical protein
LEVVRVTQANFNRELDEGSRRTIRTPLRTGWAGKSRLARDENPHREGVVVYEIEDADRRDRASQL